MKHIQRLVAWGSSVALLFAMVATSNSTLLVLGLIYLAIFNLIVYDITKVRSKSAVIQLYVLFFSIGHVLKTSFVLNNLDFYKSVGWNTIGAFDFSEDMVVELFAIELLGLLSIFLSFKWFYRSCANTLDSSAPQAHLEFNKNPFVIIAAWFLFSVFIIYLTRQLGFGMHGLDVAEDNRLPLGLGGLLLYTRNVFIFAAGLVLLDTLVQSRYRAEIILFGILYVVVALLFSVASLSRGSMIVNLFPLVYIWLIRRKQKLSLSSVLILGAITGAFFVVAMAVNTYRAGVYSETAASLDKSPLDSFSDIIVNFKSSDFLSFFDDAVNRIEGSRELMAVLSSKVTGFAPLWSAFYSGSDDSLEASIWGFSPYVEGKAFGMTYGLLGLLYIGRNWPAVFFGVALYTLGLLSIEHAFLKRGYVATSIFVSFVLFLNVWGNMMWFFMFRYLFIILFLYLFTTLVFERKFFSRRPSALAPRAPVP
jgi:hypothetical protein